MEGTRNERVAILLASYLIGFITAYIAFGVVQLEDSVKFVQVPNQNMASVIQARQEASSNENIFLAVDHDGLILIKDNERTLLSANVEEDIAVSFKDGAHVAISSYALSDDKKNVYFCELPSTDSDSCRPYIYSIQDDIVYPVTVDGERVAFAAVDHEVSWSEDGELIID